MQRLQLRLRRLWLLRLVGKESAEKVVGAGVGWLLDGTGIDVGVGVGIGIAEQSPALDQLLECRGFHPLQSLKLLDLQLMLQLLLLLLTNSLLLRQLLLQLQYLRLLDLL